MNSALSSGTFRRGCCLVLECEIVMSWNLADSKVPRRGNCFCQARLRKDLPSSAQKDGLLMAFWCPLPCFCLKEKFEQGLRNKRYEKLYNSHAGAADTGHDNSSYSQTTERLQQNLLSNTINYRFLYLRFLLVVFWNQWTSVCIFYLFSQTQGYTGMYIQERRSCLHMKINFEI